MRGKGRERAGIMISLALFLLVFFTWIILLMLSSYNRWYKTHEMKMLRTKYISPTFRNMRYNVWMINDVIEKGGELIWGDEKFSPFFPFFSLIQLFPIGFIYFQIASISLIF